MELKVWVDGIQRVVCGVSDDTTCHDVIIALANAMGRTGRFTLIEKWRDSERPLTPNEYPARSLQKWGEYASEVRFHLCQSDVDKKTKSPSPREKQQKNEDKFSHTFSPPDQGQSSETSIKRSSTFSGAHNLNPVSKSHRDQLASRLLPITESRQSTGIHPLPHSSSSSPSFSRPVPSPRRKISPHRTASPLGLPSPRNILNHSPVANTSPHNIVRPLPNRPYLNHNIHDCSSKFHVYSNHEHFTERGSDRNNLQKVDIRTDCRSDINKSPNQHRGELCAIEHTLDGSSSSHSRSASLEIEEYDLDQNFPDILRDSNRTDRPSVHTEYKLEPEVINVPETEHARLVRLVTVQIERIKTQESQIDMVDTEITSMEEKENEYEEELEDITKELLKLEQKQRDDEPDGIRLESVSWQDELLKSQKLEQDVKLQVSELKNKQHSCEKDINEIKLKESKLTQNIQETKTHIENSDKKFKDEETNLKFEMEKLKKELAGKQSDCDELEIEFKSVHDELKNLENEIEKKEKARDKMEEELKEENMKSLDKDSLKAENNQAILKILEGRLSPKPNASQNMLKTPQAFISSLANKNPNGVWV